MNDATILLVDDEATVRQGLRMWLDLQPGVCIVGEASDGEAAIDLARRLRPRVVLMDVEMPVLDGISAAARLREELLRTAVVMLSIYDDPDTVARALDAGAVAFVAKHTMHHSLLDIIRAAAADRYPNQNGKK